MKRLERTPATLPMPDPNVILLSVPWLSGLDPQAIATIQSCAKLEHFEHKEVIIQCGEKPRGVYIIVSGLVKVSVVNKLSGCEVELFNVLFLSYNHQIMTYKTGALKCHAPLPLDGNHGDSQSSCSSKAPPTKSNQDALVSTDYFGAGSVMGEAAVLEHTVSTKTVECETDVQGFFISLDDLEGIMASFPSLEEQLWRINGIHTATELLAQLPEYLVCASSIEHPLPVNLWYIV